MKTRLLLSTCLTLLVFAPGARLLYGQQSDYPGPQRDYPEADKTSSTTRAVDEADSRAAKEADRLVSLPPGKIILLLQQEPGLFLEVKKMLVRRAFAQGRILGEEDLTDEAIFRLIQDDDETRALITQQIVDRGYVRAKPTSEELARQLEQQQQLAENDRQRSTQYPRNDYEQERE